MCCLFHRLVIVGRGVTDLVEATVAAGLVCATKPNRISAGQKGLRRSHQNCLVFNAEIFVLRWSASIPFDQRREVRIYATSQWSGVGRSSCPPVGESNLTGVSEFPFKLCSM